MSTINETVNNALLNLHRAKKEEWISLKEIYEQVEKKCKNRKKISTASIRDALEKHCSLSVKFSGNEYYVLKEKMSELYKSVYYEQIKFINTLNIGDIFTRDQLMAIFKISGQSGIMKTNALNCLVLTTSENSVYEDGAVENGLITYTGEGLTGDQTITKNNKTIFESKENNIPMYLFSKDKNRKYIFEGRVELCRDPYQVPEKDIEENDRLVWKFPLSIIYPDNYDYEADEKYNEIVYEITEIENKIEPVTFEKSNDLEYREGKINIRKYRKTDKKILRSSKPDYIAQEIIKNKQGIENEKLVYETELKRLMQEEAEEQAKLMEEFFINKKENEGFDILSFELNEDGKYVEKYIEVKSTKGNEGTPIDITIDEIDFAKQHLDNYYIYRIINSDNENRYLKVIKGKDLFSEIDYKFIPTTFKIYSN